MDYTLTNDTILIFAAFIVIVFVLYKLFRILIKAAFAAAAGYSFPWIVKYLKLPIEIATKTETAIQFAFGAVILLIIYEFFHFIKYFFKVLAWPFKSLVKKK